MGDTALVAAKLLIKVSDLIAKHSGKAFSTKKGQRTSELQDAGNELRERFGSDVLSQFIIKEIAINRKTSNQANAGQVNLANNSPRRHVTIIDSLKHPDEASLFQAVYGKMFYLFGVLCPEDIRIKRLIRSDSFTRQKAIAAIERDTSEDIKHGQQMLKILYHSDFFVNNYKDTPRLAERAITRFIELILGSISFTPTVDEYAMHAAQSSSLRSACLSRQVGAAIISKDGDLVATGRNDVPRSGGGLYTAEDGTEDYRCAMRSEQMCMSDTEKRKVSEEITELLRTRFKILNKDDLDNVYNDISSLPRLKGLIEFSRAIHAEMDAIINCARNGGPSLKGATLYCTTFPCHHCARHIVATGIVKVVYIEPYEKSLAKILHSDSLQTDIECNVHQDKVCIVPFEGVSPKQYMQLFKVEERKIDGKMKSQALSQSKPAVPKFLNTYVEFEAKVVEYLAQSQPVNPPCQPGENNPCH